MLQWYLSVNSLLNDMRRKAADALLEHERGNAEATKRINDYPKSDYQKLGHLWEVEGLVAAYLNNLGRHIRFGEQHDYHDILETDIDDIETRAQRHGIAKESTPITGGFEGLLHPAVVESAYQHYVNGHYREAVLNSIMAVFDLIRSRTELDLDGPQLVEQVFSLDVPMLVLSELGTDSGQNEQKGFIQIFSGSYRGIRNPKAHSLAHDLDKTKTAQYLVFASLLARRVSEAKVP